jgi:hypothetical protein
VCGAGAAAGPEPRAGHGGHDRLGRARGGAVGGVPARPCVPPTPPHHSHDSPFRMIKEKGYNQRMVRQQVHRTPFHAEQHEWQIPQSHQHTSDNHDKCLVRATSTRQNRAGSRRVDSCVMMTYTTAAQKPPSTTSYLRCSNRIFDTGSDARVAALSAAYLRDRAYHNPHHSLGEKLDGLSERSGDKPGVLTDRERWNPAPSPRGRHCQGRFQAPHPEGSVTPFPGVKRHLLSREQANPT